MLMDMTRSREPHAEIYRCVGETVLTYRISHDISANYLNEVSGLRRI